MSVKHVSAEFFRFSAGRLPTAANTPSLPDEGPLNGSLEVETLEWARDVLPHIDGLSKRDAESWNVAACALERVTAEGNGDSLNMLGTDPGALQKLVAGSAVALHRKADIAGCRGNRPRELLDRTRAFANGNQGALGIIESYTKPTRAQSAKIITLRPRSNSL